MLYKIKHIRTGLYYCPTRVVQSMDKIAGTSYLDKLPRKRRVKSNLSKKGKIYQTVPSVSWYKGYDDENGIYHTTGDIDFVLEKI
jgi:hypothetical protein